MNKSILIIGCGGHGRVVADVAADCGFEKIAFLDDAPEQIDQRNNGLVLGPISRIAELLDQWPIAIAAVGDNAFRQLLFCRLRDAGFKTPSIVHPSAVVSRNAYVGEGVFVAPAAVINVGARIGDAAIVNTGARIDHDCVIGDASHIAPGSTLSGGVVVGARAWLGTGCSVRQGVKIAEDAIVGVGAAVVTNLEKAKTYVGVPARAR